VTQMKPRTRGWMIMKSSLGKTFGGRRRGTSRRREFNPAGNRPIHQPHMHMSIDDLIILGFIDMVPA